MTHSSCDPFYCLRLRHVHQALKLKFLVKLNVLLLRFASIKARVVGKTKRLCLFVCFVLVTLRVTSCICSFFQLCQKLLFNKTLPWLQGQQINMIINFPVFSKGPPSRWRWDSKPCYMHPLWLLVGTLWLQLFSMTYFFLIGTWRVTAEKFWCWSFAVSV